MAMASKIGWMDHVTRENGKMGEQKAMASYIMEMGIFMKVIGQTTKLMDMGFTLMQTEQSILEIGKTTSNMVKDMRLGLMELYTKASTAMGRNTVTDDCNLSMVLCTQEPSQ